MEGVSPICKDAVILFYSLSRLGLIMLVKRVYTYEKEIYFLKIQIDTWNFLKLV